MSEIHIQPSYCTSIVSFRPDHEHNEDQILLSMSQDTAQTLMRFEFNLPNDTIITSASLQMRLAALAGSPVVKCARCNTFSPEETWNSFSNGSGGQNWSWSETGQILPNSTVVIDMEHFVQGWIMFPGPKRCISIWLEGSPSDRMEVFNVGTAHPPTLILHH